MLSAEQNDRITLTGPQAPAGLLMRRYWQPAALVDELAGNRPIKPVRLLGEDLVLFRDERGRFGLIGRSCPHRGTDLAYGRLEDGGLRLLGLPPVEARQRPAALAADAHIGIACIVSQLGGAGVNVGNRFGRLSTITQG